MKAHQCPGCGRRVISRGTVLHECPKRSNRVTVFVAVEEKAS